jgi:transglutaminase-like putative cysteine protease
MRAIFQTGDAGGTPSPQEYRLDNLLDLTGELHMETTDIRSRRSARRRFFLAAAAFSAALASDAGGSRADSGARPDPEPPPYSRSVAISYVVRPGNLLDRVQTVEIQVNNAAAARQHAEQRIENNAYFSDLKILEAATLKADGRRLDVPPTGIVARIKPAAYGELSSIDADARLVAIAFPDVQAGDRIRYVASYTARREETPGGFSRILAADPADRYSSYLVTLDAPADLDLRAAAKGFSYRAEVSNGRRLHKWSLRDPPFHAPEEGSVDPLDLGPYWGFSSFRDWDGAARSFCARAEPMAAVTPEIARLADEITRGRAGVRAQAEAIFGWVSANIRYLSIILGPGGLVPRPASVVAANRYGDCKDHVTLTRSLLAAKGIASEYALINAAAPIYKEYDAPALSFDHVIVYIPELDLYADPTVKDSGLGVPPATLRGKPVLRCGGGKTAFARVPPAAADAETVDVAADVIIGPDGSASGEAVISAAGSRAATLKSIVNRAQEEGGGGRLTKLMQLSGARGAAELIGGSFSGSGRARARVKFSLPDPMLGKGNSWTVNAGPELTAKPFLAYGQAFERVRARDFVCLPTIYRETAAYRAPLGWSPARLPKNVNIKRGPAEFTARYAWSGEVLKVERRFALRTANPVCPAAMAASLAPVFNAAIRDSNRRLAFIRADGREARGAATPERGERADAAQPPRPYSISSHAAVTVRAFNRVDSVETSEILIETEEGAEQASQQWVGLDDFHDVKVLEAATLKADGRRLDVGADQIFTRAFGGGLVNRVIVFPDAAKGDRLRYVVSRKQTRLRTPGGFSFASRIYEGSGQSKASLSLDAPAELKLHIAAGGYRQRTSRKNGRIFYEWKFEPGSWRRTGWDELYVYKAAAFLEVSSYPGWKEAGEDYCGPAGAAAKVTPEIASLASDIAAGRPSRRDQAEAVFDWVAANFASDGASLANDALAPNAPASTLAMRKGTRNDVAALTRALLAARGIEAVYALTGAGGRLFDQIHVPGLSFSDVLLYLPEFDVYADPSDRFTSFGAPQESRFGRQTLRCDPGGPVLARMPVAAPGANAVLVKSEVNVGANGRVSGVTMASARGASAAELRQSIAELKENGARLALTETLRRQGLRGKAAPLELDGGKAAALKISFVLDENLLDEDDPRRVVVGPRVATRPFLVYGRNLRPGRSSGFYCAPIDYREIVVYRLPAGWKPRELPPDVDLKGGPARFVARYRFKGRVLEADRRFVAESDDAFCPAAMTADVARVAAAAERDAETRLIFAPLGAGAAQR